MPNRKNHEEQPGQAEDLQTLICIHLLHQIHVKLKLLPQSQHAADAI